MAAPVVVIHGGAGRRAGDDDRRAYLDAVAGALERGLEASHDGAAAAVLAAVTYMESDTILNAGRGAVLDRDGGVSLDAGFMEGATRRYGGVGGMRRCSNPARLARHLAGEGDYGRLLAGAEADALAGLLGMPVCESRELVTERALRLHEERLAGLADLATDTVGAVARDGEGRLAAAVSTGGLALKPPGRIGDSAVVGAGFWADDRWGACVTTGVGEALLRQGTARRCVELIAAGRTAATAAAEALGELADYQGDERAPCGLILVTAAGEVELAHTAAEMAGAWARVGDRPTIASIWHG